ncbi:hypothetical protein R1flu_018490 [Riccia fluitans]|uniref:Molybdenum cofactor sulfurase n=1 Tax=Riccia fluitans TaxID=41844 RepID=A0ABD1ZH03_9MARC
MPRFSKQLQQARDPEAPTSPVTDRSSSISLSGSRRINRTSQARLEARKEFLKVTSKGLTDEVFTNAESLPSLEDSYNHFQQIYPKFSETWAVDHLRDREYSHLMEADHVCMDYCGFGLFSHGQQVVNKVSSSFGLAYISANLPTHALYGTAEDGTAEAYIRRRVMDYLNVSDQEYSMVFTVSRGSAFKLLAESYPFHLNRRLLTVYDFESEAVNWMAECARQKGAKIMRACFNWPSLRVGSRELKKQLKAKKKKGESARGLFVFPIQSRMTGAKYSYQWMAQAQQNKWHVLLDVSGLGPKDMDSLGLSLFRPDFIVSSFYKVFGSDPTGFGCLLIKNSAIQSLHNSSRARAVGMVRIVSVSPADGPVARYAEAEEQELEPSSWRVDQQVGVSSFSGPVSSFYSEGNMKKGILPNSKEKVSSAWPKLHKSGEIQSSGYLRSESEIQEEEFDGNNSLFSGRLSGYRGHSWRESEDMSEIEYSGYDLSLEPVGRSGEIEVPKSGSFRKARTSFGSSSGEVEDFDSKPRRSLREILHEPETSPVRVVSGVLLEEDEVPTTSSGLNSSFSPRKSYVMSDNETSHISSLNLRRAGDSDESPEEEFEDFASSRFRNETSTDEMMYSSANSEDKFESHFADMRHIEEEIEEREFSRTFLSDIEEEKSEEISEDTDESKDGWNRSDDDSRIHLTPTAEACDLDIGGYQAEVGDLRESRKNPEGRMEVEPQQEVLMGERKNEPEAVTQKETTNVEGVKTSIRARIVRFVRRASFRRRKGKETSESQESPAQGHETEGLSLSDSDEFGAATPRDEYQSLQRGSQFEEVDGVLQPKPELTEGNLQPDSGISESSHATGNGVQNAHLFSADGGGTPDEFGRGTSSEKNYLTILPGNKSESWDPRPEPIIQSSDSAGQPGRKSSEEDVPDTASPAVKQGMEGKDNDAGLLDEVSDYAEAVEGSRSSEQDDGGEFPEQGNNGVAVSAPVYNSQGTTDSGPNTPKNGTSDYQAGRGDTGDQSFDEAKFHDAQDPRGMNGGLQDLRSGRTISRDDDMFISLQRRLTLAEDIARLDLEGSDDESYYPEQYGSDSYYGSSTPRSGSFQESGGELEEEENGDFRHPRIICKGLDMADSLGLTKTNYRIRYLVNWLVNSLLKLRHPSLNSRGNALVRIYGPRVKYDRGAAVAFNLFDWKGVFIQPGLVQRLADRNNISLGVGRLCNIVDANLSPEFLAEKERWCGSERSDDGKGGTRSCAGRSDGGRLSSAGKWDPLSIPVVTAALSFVTNFEDVYKLWAFIAKFLDADFLSKEMWKYHSLNQQTVIV